MTPSYTQDREARRKRIAERYSDVKPGESVQRKARAKVIACATCADTGTVVVQPTRWDESLRRMVPTPGGGGLRTCPDCGGTAA